MGKAKYPKVTGQGPYGSGVKPCAEVIPCTNGSYLHGYVRLSNEDELTGKEVEYLGTLSVGKLLRLAKTIQRRHEKWLDTP